MYCRAEAATTGRDPYEKTEWKEETLTSEPRHTQDAGRVSLYAAKRPLRISEFDFQLDSWLEGVDLPPDAPRHRVVLAIHHNTQYPLHTHIVGLSRRAR